MMIKLKWLIAAVYLASVVACAPATTVAKVCTAGDARPCVCVGDKTGLQYCLESGLGHEKCDCGDGGGGTTTTDGEGDTTIGDAMTGGDTTGGDTDDGTTTGEDCLTHFESKCAQGDLYWFDSCGAQEEVAEDCGMGCSNGVCADFCQPKVEQKCHMGTPFWFDSCGNAQSASDICEAEEFCSDKNGTPTCVKPFYNGQYEITANPDMKTTGLGNVIFPPTLVDLTVNGTSVSFKTVNFQIEVTYTGTLTGKTMMAQANYSDGTADHTESVTATFKDSNTFTGTINDQIVYEGVPLGNVIWTITGIKQ